MAAPRRRKITSVPNLYAEIDKVDGKYRFRYRNIMTRKLSRLKTRSLEEAERKALQLNAIIAQRIIDDEARQILAGDNSNSITIGRMLKIYLEALNKRVQAGEIKPSTVKDREWKTAYLRDHYSKHRLSALTTLEINKILKHYTDRGKSRMAQSVRSILIDFFNEAISAGHFPADKPNPAQVIRTPRVKVKRARLTLEVFMQVLDWAKQHQPARAHRAMLLALISGQQREDVANIRLYRINSPDALNDKRPSGIVTIDDQDYLALIQKKTGNKLLLPLALCLNSIDMSLKEILEQCRDGITSEYAIHHNRIAGQASPGAQVRLTTISQEFAKAMRGTGINWGKSDPPTFHEIRSLAEREYSKQGVNTQYLLGHKHKRMTEVYHDARGHDWVKLPLSDTTI